MAVLGKIVTRWLFCWLLGTGMLVCITGCAGVPADRPPGAAPFPAAAQLPNPMLVPIADREFLWNQTVDTVDDYFKIEREQRVRQVGNVLTEGRIDTFPSPASTLLEPWRGDSTRGFEKWHSTLQSIRRRAEIRVTPTQGGYLVDVAVFKELEDLEQPEHATVGSATLRHDGSLVRSDQKRLAPGAVPALGWIPQGRDVSLEQKILAQLQGRLQGVPLGAQQPGAWQAVGPQ